MSHEDDEPTVEERITEAEKQFREFPEWVRKAASRLEDRMHGLYKLRSEWRLVAAEIMNECHEASVRSQDVQSQGRWTLAHNRDGQDPGGPGDRDHQCPEEVHQGEGTDEVSTRPDSTRER
jgi:hypothetical protein